MTSKFTPTFAAVAFVLAIASVGAAPTAALAQSTAIARSEVKMDRDTFLATHRWDDSAGMWVLKDDMAMPAGVASRADIKAMRDKFLSMNKWSENGSQWIPLNAPRDMSKLSRDEVAAETAAFLKSHRYNESKSEYVAQTR